MSTPINIATILPVVDQPNSSVTLNQANSLLFVTGSADAIDMTGAASDVVIALGPNDSISGFDDTADTVLLFGQGENLSLEGNSGINAAPGDENYVLMAGDQQTVLIQGTSALDFYGSGETITVRDNERGDMSFPIGVNTVTAHGYGNATVTGGGARAVQRSCATATESDVQHALREATVLLRGGILKGGNL